MNSIVIETSGNVTQKPLPDFFRFIESKSLARNLFIAYTRYLDNMIELTCVNHYELS